MERDMSEGSVSSTYNGSGAVVTGPAPARPWWAVDVRWLVEKLGIGGLLLVLLGGVLYGGWLLVRNEGAALVKSNDALVEKTSRVVTAVEGWTAAQVQHDKQEAVLLNALEKLIDKMPRRR